MFTGATKYVTDTSWSDIGQLLGYTLGTGTGGKVYRAFTYEDGTGRLIENKTSRDLVAPNVVSDIKYSYDAAGNVLSTTDAAAGDNQCYRNDYLQRLTEAWTPLDGNCAADPTASTVLGGPRAVLAELQL